MEEKSSIKDTNGNIVENLDGIERPFESFYKTLLKINPLVKNIDDFEKSFEFFYKTLLKVNPPKNIFELHKEISVNQQFTQC